MREFPFRLLNVFTLHSRRFSGNPLCVFENGQHFSESQMQSIARQFNLSETTFIVPATGEAKTAGVRIFTPQMELPFAGHPTLGTAHVVRQLYGGDRVVLELKSGDVEVRAAGDHWTLQAPRAPESRKVDATHAQLAQMLGLEREAIGKHPLWIYTGAEHLVVPLQRPEDVTRARPDPALLLRHGFSDRQGEASAYVWAKTSENEVLCRAFFLAGNALMEDPATGSACANLGGWMVATKEKLPVKLSLRQGEQLGRPSLLALDVDEGPRIRVGGEVLEVGRGSFFLEP